jgi:hypothetical protein
MMSLRGISEYAGDGVCRVCHVSVVVKLHPTLSKRDRKEIKSAHSLTLSNDCRQRSTRLANFLYFASLARRDCAAAGRCQ